MNKNDQINFIMASIMVSFLVGLFLGNIFLNNDKETMEKQAIEHNFGEYIVDNNKNVQFIWKTNNIVE